MKHHDEVRAIFNEHGIKSSDGRSAEELSDEEIEEMFNEIIRSMTKMAVNLRTYVDQAAEAMVQLNKVWEKAVTEKNNP